MSLTHGFFSAAPKPAYNPSGNDATDPPWRLSSVPRTFTKPIAGA